MNFLYQAFITREPETGEPNMILRPIIPVRVHGRTGFGHYAALVDTGADNTILPKRIADDLGIELRAGHGPNATAFGGQSIPLLFGDVELELEEESERVRWSARVLFHDFLNPEDETLILGHAGFLDYFSALFDGEQGQLSLDPNSTLPQVG